MMGKMQREAILRQHLDAIREELGEGDTTQKSSDYRKKIDGAGMPEEVKKVAIEELKRLESVGNNNPEAHVIRNYLDLLCAMPWNKQAEDTIDLDTARRVLDADHYGLEKIKKRILQHLAVMKLKKSGKGPILLFVGPPGVGKTSLGASIARALGRKFVRGSLGGVRDDAEIRGHRRTYIGAMPGRIVQGIKRAGENNPVFMLDEIDKLSRGFQGDPASALLEVLDPEQNSKFLDHYLDVPFDLSGVVFIATANTLESIPAPLLDRMEIIELTGYTTAEKLHIAKNHLVPKELKEHGLTAEQVVFADDTLMRVITHYTREAGVRDLQRKIASLLRAATEKVVRAAPGTTVRIEVADLVDELGEERFIHEVAERVATPGVATGLAWTPLGGEILFIESSLMSGTGRLILTGQLGDVMKESAQIALSLVRSRLPDVVPGFEYEKKDLHIHVPAGAIPKDGPSAGIAILTTIASLFLGRSVSPRTAMTGEITLRGAVMPVGGIKEKVIAAHRAGIERVILPKKNERDLKEVPAEVRAGLKFELVENASEVLKLTLGVDIAPQLRPWGAPPAPPASAVA
jgi:ATP-dependent Lon protease